MSNKDSEDIESRIRFRQNNKAAKGEQLNRNNSIYIFSMIIYQIIEAYHYNTLPSYMLVKGLNSDTVASFLYSISCK